MKPDAAITPSQTDGAAVMEKHANYYYHLVVFEVENVQFRVPKNGFLIENPKFFDQFDLPTISAEDEGDVDSLPNTIVLKDTTSEAFHGLLLVIYPFPRTASTYEEWLGALDLATRWELSKIRTRAIGALSLLHQSGSGTAVDIILLGRKFKVDQWVKKGYMEILKQKDLKVETIQTLGWETATRLFAAKWALDASSKSTKPEAKCGNCAYASLQPGTGNAPCLLQCTRISRKPRCNACTAIVVSMFAPTPSDCSGCSYRCNGGEPVDDSIQRSVDSVIETQTKTLLIAEKRLYGTIL